MYFTPVLYHSNWIHYVLISDACNLNQMWFYSCFNKYIFAQISVQSMCNYMPSLLNPDVK